MALVETLNLAHIPPSVTLYGALYKDVENAAFLREQLLAGNSDFEYAFIDATTILSTTHILAAAFRAINDMVNDRLRSRNVHSEIVFCLSPNNNITTSLTNHGITPTTTSLLILKVVQQQTSTTSTTSTTPSTTIPTSLTTLTTHLTTHIHGTPLPFTSASLSSLTNMSTVRKLYKLDTTANGKGRGTGKGKKAGKLDGGVAAVEAETVEMDKGEVEVWVLGMMALKGS